MKRVIRNVPINSAKELSNGVFWVIDGQLLAFPYGSVDTDLGVAKSGLTYNHKRLWPDIKPKGCNKSYNYYPRGRVDVNNKGVAIIYLNPNIDDDMISDIKIEFGIRGPFRVVQDYSSHYLCHLDEGWKPEK